MGGCRSAQWFVARCLTSLLRGGASSSQCALGAACWRVHAAERPVAVVARSIWTRPQVWQIPQLQLDNENAAALDGDESLVPGKEMPRLPDPVVESMGLASPARQPHQAAVGSFDIATLVHEMSTSLSHGRMDETIHLFEEWVKGKDVAGQANKADLLAYNLLLHAKVRVNATPEQLLSIVVGMEDEGVTPNLLTFNFLLRAIFRAGNSEMAEMVLEKMVDGGPESQPDADSYNFVVALCALHRRLDAALKRMKAMQERGFVPSKVTYNELLVAAAKLRRTSVARVLLKELKNQSAVPVVATCAELVAASSEVDDAECALLALQFMNDRLTGKFVDRLLMDEGGMVAVLNTAARTVNIALSDLAWDLLCKSLGESRAPGVPAYLARIHTVSGAGDLSAAFKSVAELEQAHGESRACEALSPFSSLQPLVRACSKGGPGGVDAAYFKLEEICKAGSVVSVAAINSVILGCSMIWDADRAYQTFESMVSVFDLRPNVHSCNALLDAFGKSRRIPEVLQIWAYMEQIGVKRDRRSHALLVEAHLVDRDVSAASRALDSMVSEGHTPKKDLLMKIFKRCQREGDTAGMQKVGRMLGPQAVAVATDRRNLMCSLSGMGMLP